jgi:hypothetical protein
MGDASKTQAWHATERAFAARFPGMPSSLTATKYNGNFPVGEVAEAVEVPSTSNEVWRNDHAV